MSQNNMTQEYIEVVAELKQEYERRCKKLLAKLKEKQECCKDNYVGTIIKNKKSIASGLWFRGNLREKREKNEIIISDGLLETIKIIVIVLESPHIDEYKSRCSIAPAPALGMTGCKLDSYFVDIFKKYINNKDVKNKDVISDGTYHVILTNAIQYQCSLGINTNFFRDRLWLKLWLCKKFDKNFIDRLCKYKLDIVINLCTKGSHKKDLLAPEGSKTLINQKYLNSICNNKKQHLLNNMNKTTLQELTQEAINEYINNKSVICLQGSHPSSWHFEKNRCFQAPQ